MWDVEPCSINQSIMFTYCFYALFRLHLSCWICVFTVLVSIVISLLQGCPSVFHQPLVISPDWNSQSQQPQVIGSQWHSQSRLPSVWQPHCAVDTLTNWRNSLFCCCTTSIEQAINGAETAAIDGLVSSWSENISVSFCLRAPGYGLTLWRALGLLVRDAIQVPQLQLRLHDNSTKLAKATASLQGHDHDEQCASTLRLES